MISDDQYRLQKYLGELQVEAARLHLEYSRLVDVYQLSVPDPFVMKDGKLTSLPGERSQKATEAHAGYSEQRKIVDNKLVEILREMNLLPEAHAIMVLMRALEEQ